MSRGVKSFRPRGLRGVLRTLKLYTSKIGASNNRTTKVSVPQNGAVEVRELKVRILEVGVPEVGLPQLRPPQYRLLKVRITEIGVLKLRARQICGP